MRKRNSIASKKTTKENIRTFAQRSLLKDSRATINILFVFQHAIILSEIFFFIQVGEIFFVI